MADITCRFWECFRNWLDIVVDKVTIKKVSKEEVNEYSNIFICCSIIPVLQYKHINETETG
jgi:hypothetical protein